MRPPCTSGARVVGNVTAGVITSSPGRSGFGICCDISVITAARFAVDPEFISTKSRTPSSRRIFSSKTSPYGPSVSQKSSALSTRLTISSGPKTRPEYGTRLSCATNGFGR